jgi:hypothetical protein
MSGAGFVGDYILATAVKGLAKTIAVEAPTRAYQVDPELRT